MSTVQRRPPVDAPPLDLERYLGVLAGPAPAGQLLELRFRRGPGQPMRQRFYDATWRRALAKAILSLAERHDVYVGVLPRSRRAGDKSAVERAWTLWADCDAPASVAALERFKPAPAIVVHSGHGRHAYWPLAQPVAPAHAEQANRRLARALGADPASCDATRILRPPGTRNQKYSPPRAVELARFTGEAFVADDVVRGLPTAPGRPRRPAPTRTRCDDRLLELPPVVYVEALTDLAVTRDGKLCCPFHEDSTPSLHVYETPADGWFCFGCRRGGSIFDFAAELWGVNLRGPGFVDLRRRLEAELRSSLEGRGSLA